MGLALDGLPLDREDLKKAGPLVRKYAAKQILALWLKQRHRGDSNPLWGDEIEFSLLDLDADSSRATMLLDQERIINSWEKSHLCQDGERELINSFLATHQHALSLGMFPRTGVSDPWTMPNPPTELLCKRPRYTLLAKNIVSRPRDRVKTWLPIYRDRLTPDPFVDDTAHGHEKENHVCLDRLDIGIGCCSIQTTFQTANEAEARWLHDQLMPLGPIFLAMTASTPIWKGYLVDSDCRWQRYGDLLDDRLQDEKESIPARWTWKQSYISTEQPPNLKNEQSFHPMENEVREYLIEGGMDSFLADHFTSILSRDPLLLTEADLQNCEPPDTRLFESLYGCAWHPVRFKPPTSDQGPGWRVEFRPMEAQPTDFENAAFAIFSYLVSRAISVLRLNLYIPIDRLGQSWASCQKRHAAVHGRFWFRKLEWHSNSGRINKHIARMLGVQGHHNMMGKDQYALMTVDEIINGECAVDGFPGLMFMVECYFDYVGVPQKEQKQISQYLDLIRDRARGTNPTPATWMRDFAGSHKDYREDSYVSEVMCYDMMRAMVQLNEPKNR
ncbi:Glutamate-cysteine ligase catalytic subunit [Penicillium argentinense]|uniref:Glutamate--cysteine ligase n=1 Tax=Penicillium argentinense TaxID=1131581 RepID=A0A9W9G1K3_9EURO|nr:Glutamate-cysteine ligase catalytic subunit [Penicillium argentinense]KAJ5109925.1 Glutamate-cysteine ligase catalytic subunit [Penicillium argentinense]